MSLLGYENAASTAGPNRSRVVKTAVANLVTSKQVFAVDATRHWIVANVQGGCRAERVVANRPLQPDRCGRGWLGTRGDRRRQRGTLASGGSSKDPVPQVALSVRGETLSKAHLDHRKVLEMENGAARAPGWKRWKLSKSIQSHPNVPEAAPLRLRGPLEAR